MNIELLLDKKVEKKEFKSELARFISISQIDGKENYILTITHRFEKMRDIKEMQEIQSGVMSVLKEKNVLFTILTNEPSNVLVRKLYPLAQEFENKLRKFINLALCDANDVLKEAFNAMKKEINDKIPYDDTIQNLTLEYSDLSNIFKFLFSDVNLVRKLKEQKFLREENWAIHKQLKKIENTTIWNTCFKSKYINFHFDEYYDDLYDYRNDIMHFHCISYDEYIKARKLFKKAIREISVELEKNIVLEIEGLFSNQIGISAISQAITSAISSLANLCSSALMEKVYESLTTISSKFYETMNKTMTSLQSTYLFNSLTNMMQTMKNLDIIKPSTALYLETNDSKDFNNQEKQENEKEDDKESKE